MNEAQYIHKLKKLLDEALKEIHALRCRVAELESTTTRIRIEGSIGDRETNRKPDTQLPKSQRDLRF